MIAHTITDTRPACRSCDTPADACSWSQNPNLGHGDCCGKCSHSYAFKVDQPVYAREGADDQEGRLGYVVGRFEFNPNGIGPSDVPAPWYAVQLLDDDGSPRSRPVTFPETDLCSTDRVAANVEQELAALDLAGPHLARCVDCTPSGCRKPHCVWCSHPTPFRYPDGRPTCLGCAPADDAGKTPDLICTLCGGTANFYQSGGHDRECRERRGLSA